MAEPSASSSSAPPFAPRDAAGAPIPESSDAAVGLWLTETADLVATDADARVALWTGASLKVAFPRNWPAAFKESAALKGLLNKSMLKGLRCRAVAPTPWARERADAKGVETIALHSFTNAQSLADACGWSVVKGFCVLERADCDAGASFVAIRHWWNADADGTWIDLTPRLVTPLPGGDERVLLVESALGEKQPAALTPARRMFAQALATRLAKGGEDLARAGAGAATAAAPAAPPSTASAGALDVTDAAGGGGDKGDAVDGSSKQPPPSAKQASSASSLDKGATLDYSKWDALDVSDDEDDQPQAKAAAEVRQQHASKAHAEQAERQRAETQGLSAAIDAAAAASAFGQDDALEAILEQARASAPLDDAMEAVLDSLPAAARLAARASASAAAIGAAASGGRSVPSASSEPSLAELLKAQKVSIADAEEVQVRGRNQPPMRTHAHAPLKLPFLSSRARALLSLLIHWVVGDDDVSWIRIPLHESAYIQGN